MARAYVDDSGSGGDSRYYVLAGFKANAAIWDAFTPDWQAVLATSPSVEYFKMNQAAGRSGLFKSFSVKERDIKVNALIDLIDRHDLFAFSEAISQKDYDSLLKPLVASLPQYDSPYIFAFNFVLTAFSSHEMHYTTGDRVDFVFDIQSDEKIARHYYDTAKNLKPLTLLC